LTDARTRLSNATLARLPAHVARPVYDRSALGTGIVHLGLGAFHRAHQAALTEVCLNAGALDWGITAASLRHGDTRDALGPQDGLYTLAERDSDNQSLRVIGAIRRIIVAPEDPGALVAAMTDPALRIVSLTITEKGYTADLGRGVLRLDDAGVQHDLARPDAPQTALGFILRALALRRAAGVAPFTVLSCDNLPGNGHLTHRLLGQFAAEIDPDLARFVENEVACPSAMVDRITPATTDADREGIAATTGLWDAWPVLTEPFFQWVIEDRFPMGRPDWERAGVTFTTDVAPFEAMKLRLLNGAHTTIAAMGRLTGQATVAETMAQPVIRQFIRAYWADVAPTIDPGIDVADYTARLLTRFDNRALHHKTAQIATDASQKVPQRILSPLRVLIAEGRPAPCVTFAVAVWIRSCLGRDEAGQSLPLTDPMLQGWTGLPDLEAPTDQIVHAFTGLAPVFGPEVPPQIVAGLIAALSDIRERGVIAAAQACLAADQG
jgi:fructuronate reductase